MRASTVFALTLALLIGLGAVVWARWAGLLGRTEPARKEVQILVAARNVFPGDVIESSWVKARALKPEEMPHYEKNKLNYLPAVPGAAALRIASKPIECDTPLLRGDLKPMVKPEPLHMRLLPNMRAVNISIQKDQSAGGLIQVGEWVDVYLTTTITSDEGQETTRTAPIAQSVRVIAKRNTLWNVFASLPENKPVQFTIEVNPYRAGLIEYSKAKGLITLVPLSASEQKTLEDKRTKLLAAAEEDEKVLPVTFVKASDKEAPGEDARVAAFNKGEYSIGGSDLVRIFDLNTPPPPRAETVVEGFTALYRTRLTRFNSEGAIISNEDPRRPRSSTAVAAQAKGKKASLGAGGFRFSSPDCKPSRASSGKGT